MLNPSRCFIFFTLICTYYGEAQSTVRVDDSFAYSSLTHSGIQYSPGQWITNQYTNQSYTGTYHLAAQSNLSFTFFFRGSNISYYANRMPGYYIGVLITLDQVLSYANGNTLASDIEPRALIWTVGGLTPGDHQIVVTGDLNLGLDWLEIVPNSSDDGQNILPSESGPGASSVPVDAIVSDDTESTISYSGTGWRISLSNANFQGRLHWTDIPGDTCTFQFNGTAVWYFTEFRNDTALATISIDGHPGETLQNRGGDDIGSNTLRNQRLVWDRTGLDDGPHTLTLTHVGNSGDFLGVDFFMYLPSTKNGSAIYPKHGTSKSARIGAIVGGIVGGVVIFALVLLLIIRMRNRNWNEAEVKVPQMPDLVDESYTKEGPEVAPVPPLPHSGGGAGQSFPRGLRRQHIGIPGHGNLPGRGYLGYPEIQP
ncbi:hypothetical protein FRC08_001502 [Ceratobasidium sp. 394]|nr:hypothetical protein FRC08_001502 [Ceratobasidium sp. 394]